MRGGLPEQAAAVLERGGQVVTANARAARSLQLAYVEHMRLQGLHSWPAPLLSDWDSWMSRLYEQLLLDGGAPLPTLLTPLQEQALWMRVQREDALRVVAPQRLAQLAMQAYARVWQYGAAESLRENSWGEAHEDAERFLAWLPAFARECARAGMVSAAEREARVSLHVTELSLPSELLLVGFDRLTPRETKVIAALEAAGTQCALQSSPEPARRMRLVEAADTRQELEACARWVRRCLEDDAVQHIAVLAPQLDGIRAPLDRALRRVLLPHSSREAAAGALPWEFSLGRPLGGIPAVAMQLRMLRWLSGPLEAAEVTGLLLGGWFAVDAEEARAMQAANATLRRRGELRAEMPLPAFVAVARGLLPARLLDRMLSAHTQLQSKDRRPLDYGAWAEVAQTTMQQLGWPGQAPRGSSMFQAEDAWQRLLDQMALLSALGEPVRWTSFLTMLHAAAAQQLFTEESTQAPVQVMGIAEASGQSFDAIWVLGMTEQRWPARGRMHPLLAPALQRAHGMPHADSSGDTELAAAQMRRVAASAPQVLWSYAHVDAGVAQRPSPLLHSMQLEREQAESEQAESELAAEPLAAVAMAEPLRAPRWPSTRVAGGSEVLKRQAACRFQSFARTRLHAESAAEESYGLDARDRGVALHRALELLWSAAPVEPGVPRLHSLEDLQRAADDDQLPAFVAAAVTQVLRGELRQVRGDAWAERYLALEQERMVRRILFWLEQENRRAPFRVISLEQRIDNAQVHGLRLHLRLDRADEVDGGLLLIDYKTGQDVHTRQWSGPRPDEPQLPIYALFGGLPHVAGVGFAQIRTGEGKTRLHALAEQPEQQLGAEALRGKTQPRVLTEQMREEWSDALAGLATEFLSGNAQLNPKKGAQTCGLCGLQALCRVHSQEGALLAEDDQDA